MTGDLIGVGDWPYLPNRPMKKAATLFAMGPRNWSQMFEKKLMTPTGLVGTAEGTIPEGLKESEGIAPGATWTLGAIQGVTDGIIGLEEAAETLMNGSPYFMFLRSVSIALFVWSPMAR